jgi:hypothetical protein
MGKIRIFEIFIRVRPWLLKMFVLGLVWDLVLFYTGCLIVAIPACKSLQKLFQRILDGQIDKFCFAGFSGAIRLAARRIRNHNSEINNVFLAKLNRVTRLVKA